LKTDAKFGWKNNNLKAKIKIKLNVCYLANFDGKKEFDFKLN